MFTLAQISDVHLAPVALPKLSGLTLKQAIGLANWLRARRHLHLRSVLDSIVDDMKAQRPDHIAVTGDLVNMGLPSEQIDALGWLKSLGPPGHVTAIPGNHDVYGRTGRDPGIERWWPYMEGQDPGESRGFPFVKTIGRIAIVGTSSAVPTPPFFATGRLGEGQRRALGERLASLGQSGYCRVLLIHHPPLPGQADRLRGLTDSRNLAALLSRTGAELVLHGHNHRPMLTFAAGPTGPIPVVGAPSASARAGVHDPGAGYNLFHIGQQAGRCHIELIRRGYDGTGQIVEIERRELLA